MDAEGNPNPKKLTLHRRPRRKDGYRHDGSAEVRKAQKRMRPRCKVCGKRIRGKNHHTVNHPESASVF